MEAERFFLSIQINLFPVDRDSKDRTAQQQGCGGQAESALRTWLPPLFCDLRTLQGPRCRTSAASPMGRARILLAKDS